MARRGLALTLEPDLLARDHTGRNLDVQLLAGGQPDPLLAALDRLLQRHRHRDAEIEVHSERALLERGRAAPRSTGAAEHAFQNVLEAGAALEAAGGSSAAAE